MIPPVASRVVAGETAPEALEHVRRTNEAGVGVILTRPGEQDDDRRVAAGGGRGRGGVAS